jgi:hypothetical protein
MSGNFTPAWETMTDAEKAAFYAENPTLASITQFGQKIFGNTSLGKLQQYLEPGFVNDQRLISMGVDPRAYQTARESFRQSEINAMNEAAQEQARAQAEQDTAITNVSSPTAVSMTSMQTALNEDTAAAREAAAARDAASFAGALAYLEAQQRANQVDRSIQSDGGGLSDYGLGFNDPAGLAAADADARATGRGGSPADADPGPGGYGGDGSWGDTSMGGTSSFDSAYGYAKGGKVTKNRLKGPDPKGPDQGHGLLQVGEYVIKKSAVKKYGEGLLGMINAGKIPAKKMKSLLG